MFLFNKLEGILSGPGDLLVGICLTGEMISLAVMSSKTNALVKKLGSRELTYLLATPSERATARHDGCRFSGYHLRFVYIFLSEISNYK